MVGDAPEEGIDKQYQELAETYKEHKNIGRISYVTDPSKSTTLADLWNLAAEQGVADWILVFNDDCEATNLWLDNIPDELLDSPRLGAIAPKIVNLSKAGGYCGYVFDLFGNQLLSPTFYGARVAFSPFPLVRRRVWQELGGYRCPHSGRMYFEDADFGLRLNQAGYLYVACPSWIVLHCMEDSPVRATMMDDIRKLHPEFLKTWANAFPYGWQIFNKDK